MFHIKTSGNMESEKKKKTKKNSLVKSKQVRTHLVSSPKDDNKQLELLLH
jgi:hypothetical protein